MPIKYLLRHGRENDDKWGLDVLDEMIDLKRSGLVVFLYF